MPKRTSVIRDEDITKENIGQYAVQKLNEFRAKAKHCECVSDKVAQALFVFNLAIGFTIYQSSNDEHIMKIVSYVVFFLDLLYGVYLYKKYPKEAQNYWELANYLTDNYIDYKNKRGIFSGEDAYDKFLEIIKDIRNKKFNNDTELRNGRNEFLEQNVQHLTAVKTNGKKE